VVRLFESARFNAEHGWDSHKDKDQKNNHDSRLAREKVNLSYIFSSYWRDWVWVAACCQEHINHSSDKRWSSCQVIIFSYVGPVKLERIQPLEYDQNVHPSE
jgi:hypothetical protein